MMIVCIQTVFRHIRWGEKTWIQTLDSYSYSTCASAGCANFVLQVCIVPPCKSYLGNVYDIAWFGPLNYLLQLKEIDFRNDLASKNKNANRPRQRQVDHTKEVWFKGYQQHRNHIICAWFKNSIMLTWDGTFDLLGSEDVFLQKVQDLSKI